MKRGKKLLKHPVTQAMLAWILASYIRLVFLTNRIDRQVDAGSRPYFAGDGNAIFAFWHGRMMMLPAFCPPKHQMRVLISHHGDGLLISKAIGHFGQKTVAGSSSRGGSEAMREMIEALRAGDNISITPDGPRGPRQIASPGATTLARLSGKPILPVTFSATRCIRLGSWDRFMLALPFGRIVFCIGAPILVPKDINGALEEQARLAFEQAMNALVETADKQTHVQLS